MVFFELKMRMENFLFANRKLNFNTIFTPVNSGIAHVA